MSTFPVATAARGTILRAMGTTATGTDPEPLKDVWTILDGLPLLYRTNASPPPDGARTIIHIHGFAISGTYLLPTASRLATTS